MPQNDEFLYALVNANPIDQVMSSYVHLIRRGRNYVCNCPFHSEKTPSCTVYMDDPHFYCFGCQSGGDVITFIMKIENLTFHEAVKFLAQRAGMEVPDYNGNGQDKAYTQRRTRIYEMNRLAANFFYLNLVKGSNKAGLKYFHDRQLTPQTIKKYGLGFASDSWDELTNMLRSKGYSDDEIVDAWLGGRSKNGRIFDMFRNRVMFPIVDLRGNIIGFGGRVLDDSKPKYLNTGNTPVFDKGNNLFSMNFAKNSNSKRLILCEGYMDVIAVNQAGFENVVATLGTAITPEQARLISHYADEVIISYDSDGAGQNATQKAVKHFSDVGVTAKTLKIECAKDPDEFIKKYGADRFRMLLDGSGDSMLFLLGRCAEGVDADTEHGKTLLLNKTAEILADIGNDIEREDYTRSTAEKYSFSYDILKSRVDAVRFGKRKSFKKKEWKNITARATYVRDDINPEAVKYKREAKAEETIIFYLLRRPQEAESIEKDAPPEIFVTDFNKRVYSALLDRMKNSDRFSLSLLADEFSVDEMGKISGMEAQNRELEVNPQVFADCVKVLKNTRPSSDQENGISDDDLRALFSSKRN